MLLKMFGGLGGRATIPGIRFGKTVQLGPGP